MTEAQRTWAEAKRELARSVRDLGYPADLADLLARQLKSPRAIDRMTDYVRHGYARNLEMLADEMLAISADADAWREKKESQEAQAKYNAYLYNRRKGGGE